MRGVFIISKELYSGGEKITFNAFSIFQKDLHYKILMAWCTHNINKGRLGKRGFILRVQTIEIQLT